MGEFTVEHKTTARYIFVVNPFDQLLDPKVGLFKDWYIQNKYNIKFRSVYKNFNSFIIRFLMRVIFANKLNIIFSPLKNLLYSFDKEIVNEEDTVYFIIPTMSAIKINIDYLKLIKEKKNFKFILLIIDSLNAHSVHLKYLDKKIYSDVWDLILSFDEFDCKKNGFQYLGYFYYSSFDEIIPSKIKSDIYYIGAFKPGAKRELIISDIYDQCIKNNLIANITVVSKKSKKFCNTNLKISKSTKKYLDVIAEIKSTNCILEVLQEGQKVQSIRYFEAVVYNKKLLSNNPNLKKLPFYDERYMKYFENVDDIDWQWVQKKEIIDYKYNNEFSPLHMIEMIEKYFENGVKQ